MTLGNLQSLNFRFQNDLISYVESPSTMASVPSQSNVFLLPASGLSVACNLAAIFPSFTNLVGFVMQDITPSGSAGFAFSSVNNDVGPFPVRPNSLIAAGVLATPPLPIIYLWNLSTSVAVQILIVMSGS